MTGSRLRRFLHAAALAAVLVVCLAPAAGAATKATTTTVAPKGIPGGLPFTGASTLSLLLAALVLVGVGGFSLRAGRYHHRH